MDNKLEVVATRFSDGFYLEDQDMWNLSGIFRDVSVYGLPKELHIFDLEWSCSCLPEAGTSQPTNWSYDGKAATVEVSTTLCWGVSGPAASDWSLRLDLFREGVMQSSAKSDNQTRRFSFSEPSSDPVATAVMSVPPPTPLEAEGSDPVHPPGSVRVVRRLQVQGVQSWTAETPFLYTLVASLVTVDGTTVQAESCRVGFRDIRVSGGQLLVNGLAIVVKGANLHEHCPEGGHRVGEQLLEDDVRLMKRHNFNALRTSHYPQQPWLYELCSLYGLYVVDEANIETHGMKPYIGRLADDPSWRQAFLLRLRRMVERDKPHPSVVAWSLGNESGYGATHDAMADWVRRRDPSRLLMYEPASYGALEGGGGRASTDLICPMYARLELCGELLRRFPDMPLVQCEYSHMMGNSGGGLAEYWAAFRRLPRLQGGFIWDWADQGIEVLDSAAARGRRWAYGGNFGEEYHDGNFCLNGLVWPDRGLSAAPPISHGLLGSYRRAEEGPLPFLAKPTLIEAKQCMRPFDCAVLEAESTSSATAVRLDLRLSLTCLLDSSPDLDGLLRFTAVLLKDGLMLALTELVLSPSEPSPSPLQAGCAHCIPARCSLLLPLHLPQAPLSQDSYCGSGPAPITDESVFFGAACPSALLLGSEGLEGLAAEIEQQRLWTSAAPGCWSVLVIGRLRRDQSWAEASLPMGFEQQDISSLLLQSPRAVCETEASPASATSRCVEGGVELEASGVRVVLGAESGLPDSIEYKGGALGGARLQLMRASTDNDRIGYEPRWRAAGLMGPFTPRPVDVRVMADGAVSCSWTLRSESVQFARLTAAVQDFHEGRDRETIVTVSCAAEEAFVHQLAAALCLGRETQQQDECAAVRVWRPELFLCSTVPAAEALVGPLLLTAAAGALPSLSPPLEIPVRAVYRLSGAGQLSIEMEVDARCCLAPLPRIGLTLQLPQTLERCAWLGLGPHECYPDRKASGVRAVHSATLDSMYTPYIVTGENGSRADAQWLRLTGRDGTGVLISANQPFHFSAQPYTTEDLARAVNTAHLETQPEPFTSLNLDAFLMGVGGDDSWTASVHPKFLLKPDIYSFTFTFDFF